jgi:hypothetical protein
MSRHLTDDELIDRLYELGQDDHLAGCPDCAHRWNEMQRVKALAIAPAPVSSDFLAAQRRKIYTRLGEQPGAHMGLRMAWVPVGISTTHRPAPSPAAPVQAQIADSDDAQLFADVYSMEQTLEPSVAAPIHKLFEENQ